MIGNKISVQTGGICAGCLSAQAKAPLVSGAVKNLFDF